MFLLFKALTPSLVGGLLTLVIYWLMPQIPWVKSYWIIVKEYRRTCPVDISCPKDYKGNLYNQFPLPANPLLVDGTLLLCYILMLASTVGGILMACVRLSSL
jgi:hypothetical protein